MHSKLNVCDAVCSSLCCSLQLGSLHLSTFCFGTGDSLRMDGFAVAFGVLSTDCVCSIWASSVVSFFVMLVSGGGSGGWTIVFLIL